jgi:hypothetical protein
MDLVRGTVRGNVAWEMRVAGTGAFADSVALYGMAATAVTTGDNRALAFGAIHDFRLKALAGDKPRPPSRIAKVEIPAATLAPVTNAGEIRALFAADARGNLVPAQGVLLEHLDTNNRWKRGLPKGAIAAPGVSVRVAGTTVTAPSAPFTVTSYIFDASLATHSTIAIGSVTPFRLLSPPA